MPYRRRWQPCARNGVLFMAVTEQEFDQAEKRMTELRAAGHAVSARYDRRRARVVVALNTGVELTFPARLAEGLADAPPDALTDIEVSAAGLGLHRSEEHTSELQSLMRNSYAVFRLKKKNQRSHYTFRKTHVRNHT